MNNSSDIGLSPFRAWSLSTHMLGFYGGAPSNGYLSEIHLNFKHYSEKCNHSFLQLPSNSFFYWHCLTLIPAWISNHMPCKAWDEITYPFPNFNSFIPRECNLLGSKLIYISKRDYRAEPRKVLDLQPRGAQLGSAMFVMWDLQIWRITSKNNGSPLCC